jgi:DNA-binding NtrC family response regulator
VVSAHTGDEVITHGYQYGCMDYLTKPVSADSIKLIMKRFDTINNEDKVATLLEKNFITRDTLTLESLEIVKRINLSQKTVLITGESGTGKTCLAKIIHQAGQTQESPFIAINCAQFSDSVLESELFGHTKGAFTGAIKDKKGLIEKARGGTLFLDEVHALSQSAQQKLLTALESGMIYPVGSETPIKVNFKVICATCEPIEEVVFKKQFRRDLYYRIKTFVIHLSPLRERKCDIMPLFENAISKRGRRLVINEEVKQALLNYSWPANTREIEDLVENWQIKGLGIIALKDLPAHFFVQTSTFEKNLLTDHQWALLQEYGLTEFMAKIKKEAISKSIEESRGKQITAARKLKISKSAMSKLLDQKGDEYVQ